MEKRDISAQDILQWVMDNKDNQELIDMVSHMIFPYTSKYKNINRQYDEPSVYHG